VLKWPGMLARRPLLAHRAYRANYQNDELGIAVFGSVHTGT
jgi:hypothetical protein